MQEDTQQPQLPSQLPDNTIGSAVPPPPPPPSGPEPVPQAPILPPTPARRTGKTIAIIAGVTGLLIVGFIATVVGSVVSDKATRGPDIELSTVELPISPAKGGEPTRLITGSDQAIWFSYVEDSTDKIGQVNKADTFDTIVDEGLGEFHTMMPGDDGKMWVATDTNLLSAKKLNGITAEYPYPTGLSTGKAIDVLPSAENTVWISEALSSKVGYLTTDGSVKLFSMPSAYKRQSAVVGQHGNLWLTVRTGKSIVADKVIRLTPEGKTTEYTLPTKQVDTGHLTLGPDGAIWYGIQSLKRQDHKVIHIAANGKMTEYKLPSGKYAGYSVYSDITVGPDDNLWFILSEPLPGGSSNYTVAQMTTSGEITEYKLPGGTNPRLIGWSNDKLWLYAANSDVWSVTTDGKLTPHSTHNDLGLTCTNPVIGANQTIWFASKHTAALCRANLTQ